MEQYIKKSDVVAEIMSRIDSIEVSQKAGLIKKRDADTKVLLFKSILSLIDTLEVKEVDLEKEFENYMDKYNGVWVDSDYIRFAEHFFALGLKAQKGE